MAITPSKTDELLIEQHDQVVVMTLNRPECLNAISRDMLEELSAKMLEANKDPDTRWGLNASNQIPVGRNCAKRDISTSS